MWILDFVQDDKFFWLVLYIVQDKKTLLIGC
jgi:hypothetical protein